MTRHNRYLSHRQSISRWLRTPVFVMRVVGVVVFISLVCLCSRLTLAYQESDSPKPLSLKESLAQFDVSKLFRVEAVLSEPEITQPVFFNFDERGRLWVMNFLQYPYPAGLKMVSRDRFWRAVYDKVPVAPPNHTRGADRITIHEDTDGDGTFDKHKTFVDGLNIATSFVRGRGGVWVMNPPYLLFYPDRDNDDVPDGDPVVHLEGFGIQDTHSCANSIRWGPDGWLYGAQGSTVTGNIRRPGDDQEIRSLGQLIWRYHPQKKIYEIFAEGGGNTFGVEFDSNGRVYSGHNGGDTRGFHYVQGGYYRKGFQKHGPLSNPYTFGFFPAMKHKKVARFVHNFVIYESERGTAEIQGNLFGIEPLQGRIVRTKMIPNGSTFETQDIEYALTSKDKWFRPVDIKVGPDGAIYFADFYEPMISHRDHFAGTIDKERGRIYRLVPAGNPSASPKFDLTLDVANEIAKHLDSSDKWLRQTALRRLYDLGAAGKSSGTLDDLGNEIDHRKFALDAFWGSNAVAGDEWDRAGSMLFASSPDVRAWAIRLLCDEGNLSQPVELGPDRIQDFVRIATNERNPIVRSQLLASIRRVKTEQAIRILLSFFKSSDAAKDISDPHIPLMTWWTTESICTTGPNELLEALKENTWVWKTNLFQTTITERLMRRFALAGTRKDFEHCARLFQLATDKPSQTRLLAGFETAFQGRSIPNLPDSLSRQLEKVSENSITFKMRRGDLASIEMAIEIMSSKKPSNAKERLAIIETYGQIDAESGLPLVPLISSTDRKIQSAALRASSRFDDLELGQAIVESLPSFDAELKEVAVSTLASRQAWASLLLNEIDKQKNNLDVVTNATVAKLKLHQNAEIERLVAKHWPSSQAMANQQVRSQVTRIKRLLESIDDSDSVEIDPLKGKQLYNDRCGKCHQMFGEGGFIGPDLTSYNRSDLTALLVNIVEPSAEIREGFENYKVLTFDGRVEIGFVSDQDNKVVVIRRADGHTVTIERDNIDEMVVQKTSLMPDGLLNDLNDKQIMDLFSFLRSSQPLNK